MLELKNVRWSLRQKMQNEQHWICITCKISVFAKHTHTPINHDKTFYVVVSLSIQIYVYYFNNFDYAYQGYECKKGVIFFIFDAGTFFLFIVLMVLETWLLENNIYIVVGSGPHKKVSVQWIKSGFVLTFVKFVYRIFQKTWFVCQNTFRFDMIIL